ncbi:DUF4367 domain-containing protein [Brevibacillus formosus]|uniref:DUF4367 domain-containing protein n=1 Tax=Brevibacillus TaxID=55080 RepID=UPI000D102395|nr:MULTISPECIES: DUF4367 domain-containing protein [Brevibacillus]MBG9941313.1 hypothetical protein [Brevibacillus formosus]MED1948940.1 DUF4367 domain-containing protein [Brevibacillus formosus]MED2001463.1 DUF4367 domain-containing protein [Brevibacillus formosus]MED2085548.1 DUF4367 domain-containing protein [Brevibacillus formosus]PSK11485.1 hypothetical protein C7R94_26335 [Brevibacillus sp. NRRL NRS-603]
MMDKNPFKHMRDMLVAKPVPKVDVKHKVMAAIRAKENKEEKVVKKKIGLLVTVGMLVGASSVWAGMEMIQLKNEKGEVVLKLKQMSMQEQQQKMQQLPPDIKDQIKNRNAEIFKQLDTGEQIVNGLKPGEAVAIYWPLTKLQLESNPNSTPFVDVRSKPFTYTTWKDMEQKVGHLFKVPAEMGTDFKFVAGEAIYLPSDKYDEKAMKEEQERTKKEYVVQPIPLSDKLRNAEIEYKGQKGSAFVEVSILDDKNKSGGTLAENLEKVMIGDNEAVYSTFAPKNGDTVHSLDWVKNGTKVNYGLRAKMSVSTKEELLKMAEQINQAK